MRACGQQKCITLKNPTDMKSMLKTLLIAVLGGMITLSGYKLLEEKPQPYIPEATSPAARYTTLMPTTGQANNAAFFDFSATAEKATPAVVHIRSTTKVAANPNIQMLPPMFREFFGDPFGGQREPQPQTGTGSGVIIRSNGFIVTNNHVIDGAQEIEVTLNDNRSYPATVVGADPQTDLALLRIEADGLPTLSFANSDQVKVGQWVVAVGNPFNLASTVTAGIVSAKARNIRILRESAAIESFIQTDAAVNPGNSGGALVNLQGDLVGINTAIASPTGSYSGYSFAVPSNIVNKIVDDLMKFGKVQRGYLGVFISNLDNNKAKDLSAPVTEGVVVDSLVAKGAAEEGGIKAKDIIVQVDGKNVKNVSQLQEQVGRHRPGDQLSMKVIRKGKETTVNVKLKDLHGGETVAKAPENKVLQELGLDLETPTKDELKKNQLESGVKVRRIFPGVVRSQTDMKEGFIIISVNRTPVRSPEQAAEVLSREKGGVLIEGVYPGNPKKVYYGFGL